MDDFFFGKHKFSILFGKDGSRWLVSKELCDYLERGRYTLMLQVGSLTEK